MQTTEINIFEPVRYKGSSYLVYRDGRVFSEKSNKFISAYRPPSIRYRRFCLLLGRKNVFVSVHRIIAICYIPNPSNYPLVRHLDDNPENNNIENLVWGTDYDNKQDAKRNGRYNTGNYSKRGISHSQSKLTEDQVYEIRNRYDKGERCKDMAPIYGVGADQICRIGKRQQWNHLPEKQK